MTLKIMNPAIIAEEMKSAGISLNEANVDKAIEVLSEVAKYSNQTDGQSNNFDMSMLFRGDLSYWQLKAVDPKDRIKSFSDCGAVGCVAGWLAVSGQFPNVNFQQFLTPGIPNLSKLAFYLFVVGSTGDEQTDRCIGTYVMILLFEFNWYTIAPTIQDAILRLVWLKQKGLLAFVEGLSYGFKRKQTIAELHARIQADFAVR